VRITRDLSELARGFAVVLETANTAAATTDPDRGETAGARVDAD